MSEVLFDVEAKNLPGGFCWEGGEAMRQNERDGGVVVEPSADLLDEGAGAGQGRVVVDAERLVGQSILASERGTVIT